MKVSDFMIDRLVSRGVTHVFEVAGGSITHLLDSMYDRTDITAVSMHHEQAAAFAAEGYARVSGRLGVAMATSGPGATNLITGIGSCYFDSVPALFITGQVNTYEFKYDRRVRQIGFQETDIVNIVRPIVKDATLVSDEKILQAELDRLIDIAFEGRPGPALIDIPMNVQRADIDPAEYRLPAAPPQKPSPGREEINRAVDAIGKAVRPVILAGGGVRLSGATDALYNLAHKAGIPVAVSLMGVDSYPHDDKLYIGMIGTYGNRYANLAVANADLVIALGTRLDTRQTGTMPETFARYAEIIHVDIDPSELGNKVAAQQQIRSDVGTFIRMIEQKIPVRLPAPDWLATIAKYRSRYPSFIVPAGKTILPNYFMNVLSRYIPERTIVSVDIGQNQIWAAQTLEIRRGQRFLTEGGMAAMGSALPMAIGASFTAPDQPVLVITGDGGFQLNIQELQTVWHHKLPIKMVMLNNGCYGMIRQFQHQYFNDRYQSTVKGYSCPDFQKVVKAYGIPATKIDDNREISGALEQLFDSTGPAFIEVVIGPEAIVAPKLGVNKPIEEQDPPLPEEEIQTNMVAKGTRQFRRM